MPTLLLEIGCEELPALTCVSAIRQLPKLCVEHLGGEPTEVLVGPRRLAILASIDGTVRSQRVTGPPRKIAFDEVGAPTKAAAGFARKAGVAVEDLEIIDDVLGYQPADQALGDYLLKAIPELVNGLVMTKPMVWDAHGFSFSRPIRWLCVKLDEQTVPVRLAGLEAGGATFGHRFTSGPIQLPHAERYVELLRANRVEPDAEERRRQIREGLDALGDWSDPGNVLKEVVHLVEDVAVLAGEYDERYLRLPARVITTAMQSHQRYFPLAGARFAFVANGGDPDVVRRGNEQVLEGRLEDASFTYDRDVARGISGLADALDSITFVGAAGTYADKATRITALAEALGAEADAIAAARFCKADQAAELVREFPDLQGYIGAQYARLAGHSEAVAIAIEDQFLPDAAGGPLPRSAEGRLVAAADRIDSLTVAFALGERPTGSRDPFALRRAATGLCRLSIEGALSIEIRALTTVAYRLLVEGGATVTETEEDTVSAIETFVLERLETQLAVGVEFVRAARGSQLTEIGDVARLAEGLAGLDSSRLERLHNIYTRATRIVEKAEADGVSVLGDVRPDLFEHDAERDVAEALDRARSDLRAVNSVEEAFSKAEALAEPLERFFDDVLVMADDAAARGNRLALLRELRSCVSARLGDLAQIGL
jgi:glycyl-tRNA synthetase beta chain